MLAVAPGVHEEGLPKPAPPRRSDNPLDVALQRLRLRLREDLAACAGNEDEEHVIREFKNKLRWLVRAQNVYVLDNFPVEAQQDPGNDRLAARWQSPPLWVPDLESPHCMACFTEFSLLVRRHHCRNCGQLVCGDCTGRAWRLAHSVYHGTVLVCLGCLAMIGSVEARREQTAWWRVQRSVRLSKSLRARVTSIACALAHDPLRPMLVHVLDDRFVVATAGTGEAQHSAWYSEMYRVELSSTSPFAFDSLRILLAHGALHLVLSPAQRDHCAARLLAKWLGFAHEGDTDVVCEGGLHTRGVLGGWSKEHFVLTRYCLRWHRSPAQPPYDAIVLEAVRQVWNVGAAVIVLDTVSHGEVLLIAETTQDARTWTNLLTSTLECWAPQTRLLGSSRPSLPRAQPPVAPGGEGGGTRGGGGGGSRASSLFFDARIGKLSFQGQHLPLDSIQHVDAHAYTVFVHHHEPGAQGRKGVLEVELQSGVDATRLQSVIERARRARVTRLALGVTNWQSELSHALRRTYILQKHGVDGSWMLVCAEVSSNGDIELSLPGPNLQRLVCSIPLFSITHFTKCEETDVLVAFCSHAPTSPRGSKSLNEDDAPQQGDNSDNGEDQDSPPPREGAVSPHIAQHEVWRFDSEEERDVWHTTLLHCARQRLLFDNQGTTRKRPPHTPQPDNQARDRTTGVAEGRGGRKDTTPQSPVQAELEQVRERLFQSVKDSNVVPSPPATHRHRRGRGDEGGKEGEEERGGEEEDDDEEEGGSGNPLAEVEQNLDKLRAQLKDHKKRGLSSLVSSSAARLRHHSRALDAESAKALLDKYQAVHASAVQQGGEELVSKVKAMLVEFLTDYVPAMHVPAIKSESESWSYAIDNVSASDLRIDLDNVSADVDVGAMSVQCSIRHVCFKAERCRWKCYQRSFPYLSSSGAVDCSSENTDVRVRVVVREEGQQDEGGEFFVEEPTIVLNNVVVRVYDSPISAVANMIGTAFQGVVRDHLQAHMNKVLRDNSDKLAEALCTNVAHLAPVARQWFVQQRDLPLPANS